VGRVNIAPIISDPRAGVLIQTREAYHINESMTVKIILSTSTSRSSPLTDVTPIVCCVRITTSDVVHLPLSPSMCSIYRILPLLPLTSSISTIDSVTVGGNLFTTCVKTFTMN